MTITPELILSIFASIAAGFGAYAAIRADLATLHERSINAKDSVARAHIRIDELQKEIV